MTEAQLEEMPCQPKLNLSLPCAGDYYKQFIASYFCPQWHHSLSEEAEVLTD